MSNLTAREHDVIAVAWQRLRDCNGEPQADFVIPREGVLWWLGTIVLLAARCQAIPSKPIDATSIEGYVGKRLDYELGVEKMLKDGVFDIAKVERLRSEAGY